MHHHRAAHDGGASAHDAYVPSPLEAAWERPNTTSCRRAIDCQRVGDVVRAHERVVAALQDPLQGGRSKGDADGRWEKSRVYEAGGEPAFKAMRRVTVLGTRYQESLLDSNLLSYHTCTI